MWRHYGCEGIDDVGWGCVHRSFQNLMALLQRKVSMRLLVDKFGEKAWIEPAMLRGCIPDGLNSRFLLWMRQDDEEKKMKCTKPEHYERITDVYNTIHSMGKTHAFLVDNSTFSYCLFYDNGWLLIDPHTTNSDNVLTTISNLQTWLDASNIWMILAMNGNKCGKSEAYGPSTAVVVPTTTLDDEQQTPMFSIVAMHGIPDDDASDMSSPPDIATIVL